MAPISRTPKALGATIRRYRRLASLTQGALASRINKRQATISGLENGSGAITLETLFAVLNALELELVVRERTGSKVDVEDVF